MGSGGEEAGAGTGPSPARETWEWAVGCRACWGGQLLGGKTLYLKALGPTEGCSHTVRMISKVVARGIGMEGCSQGEWH